MQCAAAYITSTPSIHASDMGNKAILRLRRPSWWGSPAPIIQSVVLRILQQTTDLPEAGHGMILDIPVAAINLLLVGDERSFTFSHNDWTQLERQNSQYQPEYVPRELVMDVLVSIHPGRPSGMDIPSFALQICRRPTQAMAHLEILC